MLSYCLKCRNNANSKDPRVSKAKNNKIMLLSKCTMGNNKTSRFIKDQEASELLGLLETRTLLSKILLLRDILF